MDKLRNSTHESLRPSHAQRSLEEMMRVASGFFKNAYRNARKAYFDRRTSQSEFCFEINILCDERSVQWRTMKIEVRNTALQNKLTLNLVNKQPRGFLSHQVLRCFRVVWSQFWTTSKFLSGPETTTNNQEVKRSLYTLQNVNNLPKDYIRMCFTCRSLAELFNFIGLA